MSTVVSCRLSDSEVTAFDEYLRKNGLADRSPLIKKLLLREFGNVDSFSLLGKEIDLLDNFAVGAGRLSRRDAVLRLLTEGIASQEIKTEEVAGNDENKTAGEIQMLREELTKTRKQMVHMIMLAMADITHNLNENLGSNDAKGLSWKFIESRIQTLLGELEDDS